MYKVVNNYGDIHLEHTDKNGYVQDILVTGMEEDATKHTWESLCDQVDRMGLDPLPEGIDEHLNLRDEECDM
jgi:hypothetical protein